jgi:hypothetical protein
MGLPVLLINHSLYQSSLEHRVFNPDNAVKAKDRVAKEAESE